VSAGSGGVEGSGKRAVGSIQGDDDAGVDTADGRGGARIRKEGDVAMLRLYGGGLVGGLVRHVIVAPESSGADSRTSQTL